MYLQDAEETEKLKQMSQPLLDYLLDNVAGRFQAHDGRAS
jgi:hypothetical protein